MSFDTAPNTAQTDSPFNVAAGEKITLSLYNAAGTGLKTRVQGLIQQEVATGVWMNKGVLLSTDDCIVWDAEGVWRVRKLASAEAVGVRGDGGS